MKQIPLGKSGKFALIDDEDYELISQYKWRSHDSHGRAIYASRTVLVNGKEFFISMHRFIMGCVKGDGKIVDHKDGNGLNNQRSNLRICTNAENQRNKKPSGRSKYLGVCWHITKWKASININGKQKHIGLYKNEVDAAIAYNKMAEKHHGEFARLNKI